MALPVDAVLRRLGVDRVTPDLAGLTHVYRAWCDAVPFDNVQKLVHLAEGRGAPLPGSTASDFFAQFLATGAGGTCWSGNNALHDLLAALGFDVERAAATMMGRPETPPSNHGSVIVRLGAERYVTDASILTGDPLRLADERSTVLPRIERRGDTFVIMMRSPSSPAGFPCRIDRIGISADEWDAFHQGTARWGPFNFALTARVNRGARTIGFRGGQRYEFAADGSLAFEPRDRAGRDRFLVEELGMQADLVARLPDDRELPPAP